MSRADSTGNLVMQENEPVGTTVGTRAGDPDGDPGLQFDGAESVTETTQCLL